MPKRTVALLDVDHTLLFGDELNLEVVNSLKDNGINDVYLFTDMTLSGHAIKDRLDLIEQLEANGLKVHGVITPNDLAWNYVPSDEEEFLSESICNGEFSGNLASEEFLEYILNQKENLPNIVKAITEYLPFDAILSQSFNEARQKLEYNANTSMYITPRSLQARSYIAKAIADNLAYRHEYPHSKGLLLDLFLQHKPYWVSSIVVFDDNKEVIESINNFKPVDDSIETPLITMIPVESKNKGEQFYNEIIQEHLKINQTTQIELREDLGEQAYEAYEKIIALQDFLYQELEKKHSFSTKRAIKELLIEFKPTTSGCEYIAQLSSFTDKVNENRDSLPVKIFQAIFCILTLGALLVVKNPFRDDIFDKTSREIKSLSEESTIHLGKNKSSFFGGHYNTTGTPNAPISYEESYFDREENPTGNPNKDWDEYTEDERNMMALYNYSPYAQSHINRSYFLTPA